MRKLFRSIRLLVAVVSLPTVLFSGDGRAQERGAWEGAAPDDKSLHLRGRELNVVHTRHQGRFLGSDREWVWVGGKGGYVFYTNDNGKKWQETKLDTDAPVTDIYFRDDEGYLLAGNTLYRSDDGVKWRPVRTFPLRGGATPALYRMAFASDKRACIVGVYIKKQGKKQSAAGSLVTCTNDGGETWLPREVKGTEELLHVDFFDEDNGWVVGVRGAVHRTRNGGLTWERKKPPPSAPTLFHTHFVSERRGWVVGAGATIFYTSDGGDTWQPGSAPPSVPRKTTNLLSVKFIDSDNGWIVGSRGVILYTQDGGARWDRQMSGTTRDLYSLALGGGDRRRAWAVGDEGTLLKFVFR